MSRKLLYSIIGGCLSLIMGGYVTALCAVSNADRKYADALMAAHNQYQDRLIAEVSGMRNTILSVQHDVALIKYFNVPEDKQ